VIYGAGGAIGGMTARTFAREGAAAFGATLARGRHRTERDLHGGGDGRAARHDRALERHARGRARRAVPHLVAEWPDGSVRFDERGDIVATPITILRIRRGAQRFPDFRGAIPDRVVRSR
jgi:hypothetical protein